MVALIAGDPPPPCITQHPDFTNVCLCRAVLTVAFHSHRFYYETSDVPTDENRYVNGCNCDVIITLSI